MTAGGENHLARAVILAMGAAARYLGVPGEQEMLGRGVSACATCDGFFFRTRTSRWSAAATRPWEATFLTRFARSVTLIHRRDEFRASKIMLERARANDKITFPTNTTPVAVEGDGTVTGLRVRNVLTGEESTLPVTGVFVAIGHDPRSNSSGMPWRWIRTATLVRGRSTEISLPGVFAAGDLVDRPTARPSPPPAVACGGHRRRALARRRARFRFRFPEMIGAQP